MGLGQVETVVLASINQDAPVLVCEVLGQKVRLLVDTGSKVTLAQPHLYELLKNKINSSRFRPVKELPRLISVTGHELGLNGGYEVPIKLSDKQEQPMSVSLLFSKTNLGVPADGILGNNSMMRHGIDVVSGKGIRFKQETIPLENLHAQTNSILRQPSRNTRSDIKSKLPTKGTWQRLQGNYIREARSYRDVLMGEPISGKETKDTTNQDRQATDKGNGNIEVITYRLKKRYHNTSQDRNVSGDRAE